MTVPSGINGARLRANNIVTRGKVNTAMACSYPAIRDWRTRVYAAGGSISIKSINANTAFIKALGSIWNTKFQSGGLINTFSTNDINGLHEPLLKPSAVTITNVGFVSADYTINTGLNPGTSNTTKYWTTTWNPNTYVTDNSMIGSAYLRVDSSARTWPITMGGGIGTDQQSRFCMHIRLPANSSRMDLWANSTGNGVSATTAASTGLFSVSRVGASDLRLFRNGGQLASVTSARNITRPNTNFDIFRYAGDTDSNNWEYRTVSYICLGLGLTTAEEAEHYRQVQKFQTKFARNV